MADIKVVLLNTAVDEIGEMIFHLNAAQTALAGLKSHGAVHVKKQLEDMHNMTMYMRSLLGQDRQRIEND